MCVHLVQVPLLLTSNPDTQLYKFIALPCTYRDRHGHRSRSLIFSSWSGLHVFLVESVRYHCLGYKHAARPDSLSHRAFRLTLIAVYI